MLLSVSRPSVVSHPGGNTISEYGSLLPRVKKISRKFNFYILRPQTSTFLSDVLHSLHTSVQAALCPSSVHPMRTFSSLPGSPPLSWPSRRTCWSYWLLWELAGWYRGRRKWHKLQKCRNWEFYTLIQIGLSSYRNTNLRQNIREKLS